VPGTNIGLALSEATQNNPLPPNNIPITYLAFNYDQCQGLATKAMPRPSNKSTKSSLESEQLQHEVKRRLGLGSVHEKRGNNHSKGEYNTWGDTME
jgi:hypothetical protein